MKHDIGDEEGGLQVGGPAVENWAPAGMPVESRLLLGTLLHLATSRFATAIVLQEGNDFVTTGDTRPTAGPSRRDT